MKITKFPQSCFVLEKSGKRIAIDVGNFAAQSVDPAQFGTLEAVLLTHEHADHADKDFIMSILHGRGEVVANASVKDALGEVVSKVVADGDEIELGGFKIKAVELMHSDMADGTVGPINTGYIIDDIFFHPGDATEVIGLTVPVAAVPIGGPDISPRDVYDFIKAIGAKTVIPMHYDYFKTDPDFIARHGASIVPDVDIHRLENGQSFEIDR